MAKVPWGGRRRFNHDETQSAIEEFLSSGGEITSLKDDDGTYDKNRKKTEARLEGSFNPFSKSDALKK